MYCEKSALLSNLHITILCYLVVTQLKCRFNQDLLVESSCPK